MPMLSRKALPEAVRLPHLTAYKDAIKNRLMFAATEAERNHLQHLLNRADDRKPEYEADSLPPPGAIDLTTLKGISIFS